MPEGTQENKLLYQSYFLKIRTILFFCWVEQTLLIFDLSYFASKVMIFQETNLRG